METATQTASSEIVLRRYRLVRRLGGGGFGVVWLAHDRKLDRAVAVKRIPVALDDDDAGERARREGIAAARLSHPSIVALYETGSDDEAVYLVSELVRGRTLADLNAHGELSDRDVVQIGVALCDALRHAHSRGVVHRDVKPQNVIVPDEALEAGAGPPAKLTDFGIARIAGDDALTRTGDVVGTLAYMAPEQAEGREAGPPADVYALALCIYEGLAGLNPVRARGAGTTARRVGQRLPPLGRLRRDLPQDLCSAIDAAVWPDPAERAKLADLRKALSEALPRAGEERGTVEGHALEPLAPVATRVRTGPRARTLNALASGALVAAALAWLGPAPPLAPGPGALAAAALILLAPRIGWLGCAAALATWLAAAGLDGVAFVLVAAALPAALLLRRSRGAPLSAPALAPALGAVGLACAFPALAAQASRAWDRAALGALGAWWLALAEPLTGSTLLSGAPDNVRGRGAWENSAASAAENAVAPLLASPMLAVAGVWALAAVLLPVLVRGRSLAPDAVGACLWAGGLAAAIHALAPPAAEELVAGGVLAAVAAVVLAASRPPDRTR